MCAKRCPYGREIDSNGCPMPCTCKPAPSTVESRMIQVPNVPRDVTDNCPKHTFFCAIYCPFGREVDSKGCPMPCKCKQEPTTVASTTDAGSARNVNSSNKSSKIVKLINLFTYVNNISY